MGTTASDLKSGLGLSEVFRLPNPELNQAADPVLDHVRLQAQCDLPPQVGGAARDRLLVRHGIMRVRKQRYGWLRGRDARAPEVLAVQYDKILTAKSVHTMASQQSVEGLLTYAISKRVIWTEAIALRLATT